MTKNKKAIAVYLDNNSKMITEFSWLYKTWILNNLNEEWDLVVYYNPTIERDKVSIFAGIKAVPMPPIRMSDKYPFLNSHYFCLPPFNQHLRNYEFLMKTDCDVFLTHNLRNFDVGQNKFYYGAGGWYPTDTEKQNAQVQWIANHLIPKIKHFKSEFSGNCVLNYKYLTSVGASYMGSSSSVLQVTKLQAELTEELLKNHFGKSSFVKDSPGGLLRDNVHQRIIGPGLHEGIASMIAGEIAVNSIFTAQHVVPYSLDTKCWEYTALSSNVLHIHAWHTTQEWSKHDFFNKKYENWAVPYENRLDNCANYCHWVATTPMSEIRKIAKMKSKKLNITSTNNKEKISKMSKRQEYEQYLSGKRVCLVGPAPSVKQVDPAQGSQIDEYDVVVRINKSLPVPEDLKEFAGAKTNVLYNSVDQVEESGGRLDIPFLEKEIDWLVSPYPSKHPFSINIKNFLNTNRDRLNFTTFELDQYNDLESEINTRPNSGVLAILDLLSCDISELYITGITFFKGGYVEGYRDQTEEQALELMARGGYHRIPPQIDYMKKVLLNDKRVKMDRFLEEIVCEK